MAEARLNEAGVHLESLFVYERESKTRVFESWNAIFIAKILLSMTDLNFPETEGWIKEAIKAAERDGMVWNVARGYALYAELFERKRNRPRAKEILTRALEVFKKCGADGWVTKTEKDLQALS